MAPCHKRKAPEGVAPANPKESEFPFESWDLTNIGQGRHAFQWLIHPTSLQDFFTTYFEKKPLLLRNPSSKFRSLTSISEIKELIRSEKLQYGKHVDVTSYDKHRGRETLNGTGSCGKKAWHKFEDKGCSIRLLRPQEHIEGIYRLCAHLEAFVECVVGANVYLTPATSQGFAPHFDDIDAFICQVEGKKRWRVYNRRDDLLGVLPRRSSIDFEQAEVEKGGCCIDVILEEGDILYLPRGYVHQAETSDTHSLHVTVSMFQQWTWADFLVRSFKAAIEWQAASDVRLRKTLPLRFTSYMGVSNARAKKKNKMVFEDAFQRVWRAMSEHYPLDMAADEMAQSFMEQRLPPPREAKRTGARSDYDVNEESDVQSVGGGVARMVMGSDGLSLLVSSVSNSRGSDGIRGQSSTCLAEEAFAVNKLLKAYPKSVKVKDVAMTKAQDRIDLVEGLIEMGLVRVVRRAQAEHGR